MAKHRETGRHLEAFEKWYAASRDFGAIWKDLETPEQTLRNWGTWFDWHARADKRDAEARAIADREAIKRKAQMLIRHRQAAELMQLRGMECLKKREVEDPRVAGTLIKDGIAIERQGEGMPDWVGEIMSADEQQLRQRKALLEARLLAGTGADRDSAGDAAVAANGTNGHTNGRLAEMVPGDANGKAS